MDLANPNDPTVRLNLHFLPFERSQRRPKRHITGRSETRTTTNVPVEGPVSSNEWNHRRLAGKTMAEVNKKMDAERRRYRGMNSLKLFKRALLKKYETLAHAWQMMDENGDGSLQFNEFVAACRRIQFQGNFKKIFSELTWGDKPLTAEMLDVRLPEDLAALQKLQMQTASREADAGALADLSAKGQIMHTDRMCRFTHGKSTQAETFGEVQNLLWKGSARAPPPSTAKSFLNALLKKYDTLERAWVAMDTNGDGSLQFHEFVHACRRMNFAGSLKKIFKDLTGDKEELIPDVLSPGLAAKVSELRQKDAATHPDVVKTARRRERKVCHPLYKNARHTVAETMGEIALLHNRLPELHTPREPCTASGFLNAANQRYGKLKYAWGRMDQRGAGRVNFRQFAYLCRELGIRGNLKLLFDSLGAVDGRLRPEYLDTTLPEELALLQASSVFGSDSDPESMCSSGSDGQRTPRSRDNRHNSAVPNTCQFKEQLRKRYDCRLDRAWKDMDTNGDGIVQFHEFVAACRKIPINCNLRKFFTEITGSNGECLTPLDLDASLPRTLEDLSLKEELRNDFATEAGEFARQLRNGKHQKASGDARAFKEVLLAKYGSFKYAWEDLDTNGDGLLQYGEFVRGCRKLQFGCIPRHVFEELAGQGASELSPEGLDPDLPARLDAPRAPKCLPISLAGRCDS